MKKMALENLADYRRELVNALNWYKEHEKSDKVSKSKNYILINAEEGILPTMIGTLGSILSKSSDIEKNIFILSLARNIDNTTKISLRITGNPEINLKEVISSIIERIQNGTAGGHVYAAGAVIDTDFENKFIDAAKTIMAGYIMEESVN
jgi:nanoRNase/pAp phosphatase (c-di-AMP/oligoRNAs hydrolase)